MEVEKEDKPKKLIIEYIGAGSGVVSMGEIKDDKEKKIEIDHDSIGIDLNNFYKNFKEGQPKLMIRNVNDKIKEVGDFYYAGMPILDENLEFKHFLPISKKSENKISLSLFKYVKGIVPGMTDDYYEPNDIYFEIPKRNDNIPKIKIICPGPDGFGGKLNFGKHNIRRSITLSTNILVEMLNIYKLCTYLDEIVIKIRGHSRGAVTASFVAKNIESYLSKLGQTKIKYTLTTFLTDPCTNTYGFNNPQIISGNQVDFKNIESGLVVCVDPRRIMKIKGHQINATDYFSFGANNSKVVVLTYYGHSCLIDNIYVDPVSGKKSLPKWNFNSKQYNFTHLFELPKGLYYPAVKPTYTNEVIKDANGKDIEGMVTTTSYDSPYGSSVVTSLNYFDLKQDIQNQLNLMTTNLDLIQIWGNNPNRKTRILNLINEQLKSSSISGKVDFDSSKGLVYIN